MYSQGHKPGMSGWKEHGDICAMRWEHLEPDHTWQVFCRPNPLLCDGRGAASFPAGLVPLLLAHI